jgi:hypothetical protein
MVTRGTRTMQTEGTSRFPDAIRIRLPDGMRAAVALVARRRHLSSSDYIRQLVLDRLSAEGVSLAGGRVDEVRP